MKSIEFTECEIDLMNNALNSHLEALIVECGKHLKKENIDYDAVEHYIGAIKETYKLIDKLKRKIDNE